jgi:malate dehydrogenase (oxaloacetate-decarboxylating)
VGGLRRPARGPILNRHRDQLLTFNDDVQGTAAMVARAMAGATVASGTPLRAQRIVMLGKGATARVTRGVWAGR